MNYLYNNPFLTKIKSFKILAGNESVLASSQWQKPGVRVGYPGELPLIREFLDSASEILAGFTTVIPSPIQLP